MLEIWLKGQIDHSGAAEEMAALTEKFSGADLRSVVKQAMARAAYLNRPLTMDRLLEQIERKRARVLALYDEFRELRLWGQQYCDPAAESDN